MSPAQPIVMQIYLMQNCDIAVVFLNITNKTLTVDKSIYPRH
ncbi:hypothetical protein DSUL_20181 [Desulfovibrionales bacterium]